MATQLEQKLRLWDEFCLEHGIIGSHVPLFESTAGYVNLLPYGEDQRPVLQRSNQMEQFVIAEVEKVIADHERGGNDYEGLLYIMYRRDAGRVIPLYIGKSEKFGRKAGNLSSNIKGIRKNRGNFCRWGYNYAYHIGDLSAVVCATHPNPAENPKYERWAKALFRTTPAERPELKIAPEFWIKAWQLVLRASGRSSE